MIEFATAEVGLSRRQRGILEALGHGGHIQVVELAEMFNVSSVSIRKDLKELEARSLLKRVYGGAIAMHTSKYDFTIVDTESEAKQAMAVAAACLIEEHDTLLLDGGSSAFTLAQLLPRRFRHLTVITNSVPVMALLSKHSDFDMVGLGGNVHTYSMALIGPITVRQLADLRATRMFFSATGATVDRGLWIPDVVEAETKTAMLRASRERIALVEHQKFNDASLAPFAPWSDVDTLVTDRPLPKPFTDPLRRDEVCLVVADGTS